MISKATADFWRLYLDLPPDIQEAARQAHRKFLENPAHPSLHLERLRYDPRTWSVRVTLNYRAVAYRQSDSWLWFWIGSHRDFEHRFPV